MSTTTLKPCPRDEKHPTRARKHKMKSFEDFHTKKIITACENCGTMYVTF